MVESYSKTAYKSTHAANKKRIDILVTEKEFEILEKYCEENGQTKTAILRELIRKLEAQTDGTKQRNRSKAAKAATG